MNKEFWKKDIKEFMSKERWFDIPNYEGFYKISNYGRVKSISRLNSKNQWISTRILKTNFKTSLYSIVGLCKEGIKKNFKVHKIIQLVFFNNQINICDHIDRKCKNNTVTNIRTTTQRQNTFNSKRKKGNFKGVSYHNRDNLWRARIQINGKEKSLGYRKNEIDAAKLYDNAAKKEHGEFAVLNFS